MVCLQCYQYTVARKTLGSPALSKIHVNEEFHAVIEDDNAFFDLCKTYVF